MLTDFLKWLSELFTWFFAVAPWEQAIRVRAGKHVRLLGAGFYIRIPFIDRIYKQSIRRRLRVLRPQTVKTSDDHVVSCVGAVGYEITDLKRLYNTVESPNDTIECEVASLIVDYIGGQTQAKCTVAGLEKYVMNAMDLSKYGLGGQEFYVTSMATARTYRLITGDMPGWNSDNQLSMSET